MGLRAAGRAFQPIFLARFAALTLILVSCVRTVDSPGVEPTPSALPAISEDQAEDALGVAQEFVTAVAEQNRVRLWDLLAPEERSGWTGQEAFAAFIERKFGTAKVDFDLGRLALGPDERSVRFPVSLRVAGVDGRFAGPPLVLVRDEESWAVADAGPLGRHGPVIGSPEPVRPEFSVPILTYHHVATELPGGDKNDDTVTTTAFAEQLKWLADSGHVSISVAELFNAFYYDLPLSPEPVILVFDDGYADFYENAYPLLRERGFRASVSAITGSLGGDGYLTWDQAREMSETGIEFLSHTVNHANLAGLSADETRAEITQSRRALEENLARPAQFFVYPYGEPFAQGTDDKRATAVALLQEAGYRGALTTSSGPPYISLQPANAPYILRRIPVSGGERLEHFAASIEPSPTPTPAP